MTIAADSALLTVSHLAEELAREHPPVLLDVRWAPGAPHQHNAFLAGHIPGAHWCDLDADLAGEPGAGGRHPLPDPARLTERLRSWGIDADSEIVAYDGAQSLAAARAWWILRWAGLHRVRVLDGGFAAWSQADQAVETGDERASAPGSVTVVAGSLPVVGAGDVLEWAARGKLLDVRSPERFRGEVEPMDPIAGRIPGARNGPTTEHLTSDGHFRPPRALLRQFDAWLDPAGDDSLANAPITDNSTADEPASDGPDPVAVYCGSGVTAAHTLLAMHEAGIEGVLYPGSWSEWITDPSRPIASG
ncbi:MAG: Rhodanese domain protein [Frankiales bacterium]|nr:Rhodanese domain protein [Frankiales bacterium]